MCLSDNKLRELTEKIFSLLDSLTEEDYLTCGPNLARQLVFTLLKEYNESTI